MGRGWKPVQVGDELLVGAAEGGFFGLEEFQPEPGSGGAFIEALAPSAPAEGRTAKKKRRAAVAAVEEAEGLPAQRPPKRQKAVKQAAAAHQEGEPGRPARPPQGSSGQETAAAGGGVSAEPQLEPSGAAEQEQEEGQPKKLSRKATRAVHRAKVQQERKARKAARKLRAQEQQAGKLRATAPGGSPGGSPGGAAPADGAAAQEGGPEAEGAAKACAEGADADGMGAEAGEAAPAEEPPEGMAAWEGLGLSAGVLASLKALGFVRPTPVQAACIPPAVRGRRDIIGAAQTGSGKTLAFGLPIVELLLQQREQAVAQQAVSSSSPATPLDSTKPSAGGGGQGGAAAARKGRQGAPAGDQQAMSGGEDGEEDGRERLQALILAPTRELAMQVAEHITAVAKPAGIWVVPIVGGISQAKQERLLGRRPAVVVATPGRLWDLMRGGDPHLGDLAALRFLVLDEADRMVQQGRFQELANILEAVASQRAALAAPTQGPQRADEEIPEGDGEGGPAAGIPRGGCKPPLLQCAVFSATLTLPQRLRGRLRRGGGGASGSSTLEQLMDRVHFRGRPAVVDLTAQRALAERVTEAVVECGAEERDEALYAFLSAHPARTLVFVNAVSAARRLVALLKLLRVPAAALHASMQQRARLKALARFRGDARGVLVASDVAARGLDVLDVRCVVHYQVPASADVYEHRSGRTARGGAEGLSVALVTPADLARHTALVQALGRPRPPAFPLSPVALRCAARCVRLAVALDEAQRASSKAAVEAAWRARTAEAAGVDLSSDEGEPPGGSSARGTQSPRAAALAQELAEALAEPMQPGFSQRYFTGVPSVAAALAGSGAPGGRGGEAAPAGTTGGGVTPATGVALAQETLQRRQRLQAAAGPQAPRKGSKKARAAQQQQQTLEQAGAAALRLALRRRAEKRQRRRVVAVPPGYVAREGGSPQGGRDALSALREKLAREHGAR